MLACERAAVHVRRRVVLTGGPGAGKTALLEMIRQSFCITYAYCRRRRA
jgi:predicted ATPase